MATWTGMDDTEKASVWVAAGLARDGTNIGSSNIRFKEGDPMVGKCSFDDCEFAGTPTARWPTQCSNPDCGAPKSSAMADATCCRKWFFSLRPAELKINIHQNKHLPNWLSDATSEYPAWCKKCMTKVAKEHKALQPAAGSHLKRRRADSTSPQSSPAKGAKTGSRHSNMLCSGRRCSALA